MEYARFSICITPNPDSDLARLGRHWLGWDMDQGAELPLLRIEDLEFSVLSLSARLRRFGFHAPLTTPFRLADGHSPLSLHHTAQALSAHLDALEFPGLHLVADRARLSLRPIGDTSELLRLRHVVERVFDEFRAPAAGDPQRSERRRSELSSQQMQAVIDPRTPSRAPDAPFEYALSCTLLQDEADDLRRKLLPILTPTLPRPYRIQSLSLCGEDPNGWFRVIQRYPLVGAVRPRPADIPTLSTASPHVPLLS
ncbi:MAG: DUF1045 domain-containing protein [Dinoroseobacter sp.]|nr:DUF1045 domain-containing protein [Dinoroseobacter sp.]